MWYEVVTANILFNKPQDQGKSILFDSECVILSNDTIYPYFSNNIKINCIIVEMELRFNFRCLLYVC